MYTDNDLFVKYFLHCDVAFSSLGSKNCFIQESEVI